MLLGASALLRARPPSEDAHRGVHVFAPRLSLLSGAIVAACAAAARLPGDPQPGRVAAFSRQVAGRFQGARGA
eukprot:11221296-Lingulodinium_polyedra.AAC.1